MIAVVVFGGLGVLAGGSLGLAAANMIAATFAGEPLDALKSAFSLISLAASVLGIAVGVINLFFRTELSVYNALAAGSIAGGILGLLYLGLLIGKEIERRRHPGSEHQRQ
jgi:hypothetical protein